MSDFEVGKTGTHKALSELGVTRDALKMGLEVVEDFMPNIGQCALQDYGRLNDFYMVCSNLGITVVDGKVVDANET